MDIKVNSATLLFNDGQTTGILINFNWAEKNEYLNGSIAVPMEKVTSFDYSALASLAKQELVSKVNEGTGEPAPIE